MFKLLKVMLLGLLLSLSTCSKKVDKNDSWEYYEIIKTVNVDYSVDSLIKARNLPFKSAFQQWEISYIAIGEDDVKHANFATTETICDTVYVLTVTINNDRDLITFRKEEKGEF